MKIVTHKFIVWLMRQTLLVRYLAIAVLFHALIAVGLLFFHLPALLQAIVPSGVIGNLIVPPLTPPEEEAPAPAFPGIDNVPNIQNPGPGPKGPAAERQAGLPGASGAIAQQMATLIGIPSDAPNAAVRFHSEGFNLAVGPTTNGKETGMGLPGMLGGSTNRFAQRTAVERGKLLQVHHGTPETEKSVMAALRWLRDHQEADGSWGTGYEAQSALAVLCFLGHGETPDSDDFGSTVSKGISYLTSIVGPNGIVKSQSMYCQGAVTLALAEAYGMTQSPLAREPLARAISAILSSQQAKKTEKIDVGGWRYTPSSADSDVSITGWLIMGLKSARLAGLSIPDDAFELASKYLWNCYTPLGGFGYNGPAQGYATTAVGALCQQFLGHADDKRIKKALDYYKDKKVDWANPPAAGPWSALYAWYYATQAMFQGGGAYWEHWNKEISRALVKAQSSDGHWDVPGKGAEASYGLVYSTTLCCLMLEVYYRYLPLYQEMERKAPPAAPAAVVMIK